MNEYQPARTLRDVFNAANPLLPLPSGDPRYVDCTEVRGNEDVVTQLFQCITWSDTITSQLFTGHRGCGKSTELLRLRQRLTDAGYAVIYFDADEIIDIEDTEYTDVLVAIARQVFEGLETLGVNLSDDLLESVFAWFAEVVYEQEDVRAAQAALEAEFSVKTPTLPVLFASLMGKITGQLRTGVESKRSVRRRLDPQIAQLLDKINLLLRSGEAQLRKRGQSGLVVIVDGLDRVMYRTLDDGRRNSHDALFIEHGDQLRACRVHLVYTVPISMFYSPRASVLANVFPDYRILPMIKVHTRDNTPAPDGLAKLREILARRIDLSLIFEEEGLEALCTASGGHPRILMTLVRNACTYAANRFPQPIDANAAERAISRLVSEFSRSIPEDHFPLLAQVYRRKQVNNDDPHRLMLQNLSVLEYMNGAPPWQDVQPVVQRLDKFQEVLADGT
ncbi:MAG: AAA family ATPase [Caldilinea sp.]